MKIHASATKDDSYASLLQDIERTKGDLQNAYSHFDNAIEPDMIDSCIYQVNAIQNRYHFLLQQLKQM